MPCSVSGQRHAGALHLPGSSGPPPACSRLPSASNSITEGAGLQQRERRSVRVGGLGIAPLSSSVRLRGRWLTQMWSWLSTASPPTWPMSQLLGRDLGQEASTSYRGGLSSWLTADVVNQRASTIDSTVVKAQRDRRRTGWLKWTPPYSRTNATNATSTARLSDPCSGVQ